MIITLIIAIGAPLAIISFIIYSDKFKEPLDLILKTFFLGIFLCIPAGELNYLLIPSPDQSYFAGLTEESLKFLVLYFYIRPKTAFNEPMDAIVYGTIVSLGFATLENLSYVYSGSPDVDSMTIAIMRAISAIPLHASCGIIMGYFFGLHAFLGSKSSLIKSLIIPISIHATYNYLIGFGFLWFYFLFAVMFYAQSLHKKVSDLQLAKSMEQENKNI
ncbi:PrsW family glutamic-type intramembrane protease [Gammaproteobacteria bacterium]|nr:PrsW family glutamic-type intramembrane protease [Gammaproteobacteria bacterium]